MKQRGFTLLELSIVLVIIGLLVGGVMVGREMIRGSEKQATVSEIEALISALQNFKTKYKSIPGDMPNATDFWPAVSVGCTSQTGTPQQTCNGNGDERLGEGWSGQDYERFRVWQHLSLAGMIEGSFTGVTGPNSAYDMVPNVNIPGSKRGFGIYSVEFMSAVRGSNASIIAHLNSNNFDLDCGTCLQFAGQTTGSTNISPIISPGEASQIDAKIDDGKPATGIVTINNLLYSPSCVTSTSPATATYSVSNNIICSLLVRTGL